MTERHVDTLVDHLFRHRAGEMVAALTRIFGSDHLDLAEEVVQEALVSALQHWPYHGVPENPGGWLVTVARNRALDVLRRRASFRSKEPEIAAWAERARRVAAGDTTGHGPDEIRDDQLRLMFTCCHEAVAREARVALTLKTLGGFGIPEIARAFLCEEGTVAQRIVRAKRTIREAHVRFEMPPPEHLPRRLDSVLETLYLMFNEGFGASDGPDLVRADLVREAIRLAGLLLECPETAQPRVHALLALMLLQGARLAARVGDGGELILLEHQDRTRWDPRMIAAGYHHLQAAKGGPELTEYHLQAGIASCHAMAPTFEATNWAQILTYYDLLIAINPSPVVSLNRAVAVALVRGLDAGMQELDALEGHPLLRQYYLLPATRGELLLRLARPAEAAECFRRALAIARCEPERDFLEKKLAACKN